MDIWEKMYEEAQKLYNPHEVSDLFMRIMSLPQ